MSAGSPCPRALESNGGLSSKNLSLLGRGRSFQERSLSSNGGGADIAALGDLQGGLKHEFDPGPSPLGLGKRRASSPEPHLDSVPGKRARMSGGGVRVGSEESDDEYRPGDSIRPSDEVADSEYDSPVRNSFSDKEQDNDAEDEKAEDTSHSNEEGYQSDDMEHTYHKNVVRCRARLMHSFHMEKHLLIGKLNSLSGRGDLSDEIKDGLVADVDQLLDISNEYKDTYTPLPSQHDKPQGTTTEARQGHNLYSLVTQNEKNQSINQGHLVLGGLEKESPRKELDPVLSRSRIPRAIQRAGKGSSSLCIHYTISQDTTTSAELRTKERLVAIQDRKTILPAKSTS
ncbi:hypothetical protein BU26DRAFT_565197 [Trematosphaeria pertusa]|uniref:Uncharacterized protein n=1 Tax=Trematosphaeria pertusa TaxID=390896 RepID=A0A6A6IGL6_9PLEO|nr:uncharacterized protein BU26DRAFT_565197 [Trematosphaeria pertusa]KAF2249556.1 hypothetical protein BU26DRAFT_565197 [Trematosphaeria pertusa]